MQGELSFGEVQGTAGQGMSVFMHYFNQHHNTDNSITTNYGIHRSLPTMDFSLKNNPHILIQIEDLEYRRAAICKENELNRFEKTGWFDPQWKSKTGLNYRSFNDKDGKKFYYQFEPIKPNEDFSALSEKIVNDLQTITNTK